MRKEYIWEVKVKNTPLLKRKCSHCDSDRFYCSGKFRMNAQKKNIDIWLISRCVKCDSTYNMTIFSRTKTESINKELFNKFSENNEETAWQYAFSQEICRRNNVELDFESVGYAVQYDEISVEDILNSGCEIVAFKIKCPFDFCLKLSSVIRICLKLSSNELNKLAEVNAISVDEKCFQKKFRVKDENVVKFNIDKLRSFENKYGRLEDLKM